MRVNEDQRFYASTYGRFNTPDPKGGSAKLDNPLSWNRYSYTLDDPINGNDPTGLDCGDGSDGECNTAENGRSWDSAEDEGGGVYTSDVPTVISTTATAASPTGFFTSIGNFVTTVTNNPYLQLAATVFVAGVSFAEGNPGPLESAVPDVEAAFEELETSGPSFLGQANGPAIPVPAGAAGPTVAANENGMVFTDGAGGNGLAPNVNSVRVMDPTPYSPTGYVNYGSTQSNGGWQTVNPFTGVAVGKNDPSWHIPLAPRP
jgi:hypothetical protein